MAPEQTHRTDRVVLVEGESDRAAVHVLAERAGLDLASSGVSIVAMDGVTNIGHAVDAYGPAGAGVRLAGMFDIAEAAHVARAVERAGLGRRLDVPALEPLGFFACDRDLEDELIGSLGVDAVLAFVEDEGELRSFETMQRQPAQRGRDTSDQLHRFIGSRSGRKLRYAEGLVRLLDLDRLPRPLAGLVAVLR